MMNTPPSVDVDVSGATRKEEVQEQLALAFNFPEYHGKNWDAFWECISLLETMPGKIRIKGMKTLSRSFPLEAALLRKCLDDFRATPRGAGIEVTLE